MGVFTSLKLWWNQGPRLSLDPSELYDLLRGRSNAEIAARLAHRGELHRHGGAYLQRTEALDRIAAERICELEKEIARLKGNDQDVFHNQVVANLAALRNSKPLTQTSSPAMLCR